MALRKEGLPALDLWEAILGRKVRLVVMEDNQAASRIVKSGKSQELRHVHRVHGISICSLHEWHERGFFVLEDCHTMAQAADIFHEAFRPCRFVGAGVSFDRGCR